MTNTLACAFDCGDDGCLIRGGAGGLDAGGDCTDEIGLLAVAGEVADGGTAVAC